MDVINSSRGSIWRRVLDTNIAAAAAAFVSGGLQGRPRTARIAGENIFTAGGGLAILDLRGDVGAGGMAPNNVMFKPFGTDANNESFSMRVWGIEAGQGPVGATSVSAWEATLMAEVLVTLGNVAGANDSLVVASDFYADTVGLTYGSGVDNIMSSNAADLRGAWFRCDTLGFQVFGVEFQEVTAATMNALYRPLW